MHILSKRRGANVVQIYSAISRPRVARLLVEASNPASSVRRKLEGKVARRRGILRNKPKRFGLMTINDVFMSI